MNVLVVKTSSMGDVLHTLPALTDAHDAYPDISFDWVVEEEFHEIPGWHYAVGRTIPITLRRWRKWSATDGRSTLRLLRTRRYDRIIDAQGLMKSAIVASMARGPSCGMSFDTVREKPAALAYTRRFRIPLTLHAVERVRRLFAAALEYHSPQGAPDYGINFGRNRSPLDSNGPYLVFLHATTWATKHWPEERWRELVQYAEDSGFRVLFPWGSVSDKAQAQRISGNFLNAELLPRLKLGELAAVLTKASGAVAVDTGLGHLCAALSVPCVSIYGATNPDHTGTVGRHQEHIRAQFQCAPCMRARCTYTRPAEVNPACYSTVPAQQVWSTLQPYL